ncbi:MAG TPA: magnesium/cobalt transporter CorA [Chloroflexia bacterium]|nr:magnesium/cobalt transporter CorA [Chloroflexia bacterium]
MQIKVARNRQESGPPVAPAAPETALVEPETAGVATATPKAAVLNIRTVQANNITWVDIQRPGRAEMEWLKRHYNFHPLHLEDVISKIQRPKLDERDDYIFIVLHWPVYNKITRLTTPSEVDIFIGKNFFITVHTGHLRPLTRYFQQCVEDEEVRTRGFRRSPGYLFYRVIDKLVDYCFGPLNKIDQNIEAIEDLIFSDNVRTTVYELSLIRRDIIAFRRLIKPQIAVMASLERRAVALQPLLGEDLSEYFSDLNDHLSKIWDTLEDDKDVIEGLSDTNNSLTNTRINDVIKVLTIFSVIMLPLTLVSSIYGMNFETLPLSRDPNGFWIAMAAMVFIAAAMLAYFKKRRWI